MKAYGIGLVLVLASMGGKCDDDGIGETTLVSIEPIRGRTTLDGDPVVRFGRGIGGARLETERDAIARVSLDGGARLLLAPATKVQVTGDTAIVFTSGKVWLDAPAGTPVDVAIGTSGALRLADASASIESSSNGVSV